MAMLSKGGKSDNFQSHNPVKLNVINVKSFLSNFVECKSFLESNSPDILALFETNLNESIDSCNFSVRGYLPIIRNDSVTHMHGLAVYVKGLRFARDLSLENSADSYLCCRLALLHSTSYFFFLYQSLSSSLCTVSDVISSNRDEVLLINPCANVFELGDLNVLDKDWLTYSSGTGRPGELCVKFFLSQIILLLGSLNDRLSPALLDFFFLTLVFVLQ